MSAAVAKDATGKSASYLIGLDDQPGAALLAGSPDGGYVIAPPSTHGSMKQLGVSSLVPARHSRAPSPPRTFPLPRFLVSTRHLVRSGSPCREATFRDLSIFSILCVIFFEEVAAR